jgi:hypothetical protein
MYWHNAPSRIFSPNKSAANSSYLHSTTIPINYQLIQYHFEKKDKPALLESYDQQGHAYIEKSVANLTK